MKKLVSILAAVLLVVVVGAPAFANQPPKGTEGPDIRLIPPKGTEGPDTRLTNVASVVKPKGTEGPDIRLMS